MSWQDGSFGGMAFKVLPPATPSVSTPVVFYMHQLDMGIPNNVPGLMQQITPWFTNPSFAARQAIVVVPLLDQSADPSGNAVNFGGVSPAVTAGRDQAMAVLNRVLTTMAHDDARIYVTGNSLGGIGTWEMVAFRPSMFAAAMPLAGANYARDANATADALKDKPIWSIHGANDTSVPLTWDRSISLRMVAIGGAMKYSELPGVGHDVWDIVYPDAKYWDWLFAQRLGGALPIKPAIVNLQARIAGDAKVLSDLRGQVGLL